MSYLYMPFLYFPTDKSEYIPAAISLVVFMTLAVLAMYFMYKKSKKDEESFNKQYEDRIKNAEKLKESHD
ncbi:hypothetical protein D8M04_04565 [Oceanobacillus piezotolerans]|uniref:Uncharacterized protein n=1 Tax=Oceanobacillus piezotolerans TaxID=2448030 RepID=A0A498D9S7_9BACI|nr:hypothetical protein [Oceanobacillus piezotolerans]RLL46484.1 hypothetical protein D8M04_04565 [Oceanobacillus piezotolerans]